MININKKERYPFYFFIFYLLIFMSGGVFNTFLPLYFKEKGFDQTSIGTLLAIGPFVAILAQPLWGLVCDRAHTKNNVLRLLMIGSVISAILLRLNDSILYLCFGMAALAVFQSPIFSVNDSITLEYLQDSKWNFGPIRMAGTIGFAAAALGGGFFARKDTDIIFLLFAVVMILSAFTSLAIPKIKGHQSNGNKVSIWVIFKNREFVILMSLNLIFSITIGFNGNFFAIYYRQLGADNSLVGWVTFITAIAEIPFLFFADRILGRFGTKKILIVSLLVTSLRWFLQYVVTNVYGLLAINVLHGMNYIVFAYSLATYINDRMPKELRTTGQTINGLIAGGLAKIIASIGGGALSDAIGTRPIYLYMAILDLLGVVVFSFLFFSKSYETQNRIEV